MFTSVPTMLSDMFAEEDNKKEFAKLRGIMVSGAPIRPATALALESFLVMFCINFMAKLSRFPLLEWAQQNGSLRFLALNLS